MKLYKNLVNAVAETLSEIFTTRRYTDRALEKLFRQNPKWGSRDRKFVAESVYDIVRYFRYYSELAESTKNFWFITAVYLAMKGVELPEWPEFRHVDAAALEKRSRLLREDPRAAQSYPDWLWDYGAEQLGEERWILEARSMNVPAEVVIRTNTLKTDVQKLSQKLLEQNIATEAVSHIEGALILKKRENVFRNQLFQDGWFEIQDAGSQMIGHFVEPMPEDTVIDACAGGGGKSLHLAALMKNKGRIISMDVEEWKLEELRKRARRAGAFNIETRHIESAKTVRALEKRANKLLLDVPCSGSGVIRRNPDAKWKLSMDVVEKTRALQQQILNDYCVMLKPGGKLVYATCSIFPSENYEQVETFLKANDSFVFVRDKTVYPSEGFDGFYMCELKRIQ